MFQLFLWQVVIFKPNMYCLRGGLRMPTIPGVNNKIDDPGWMRSIRTGIYAFPETPGQGAL